ncbi:hypothetical protein HK096_001928 [Nowakowskiella sp. JEL0078]|nr:hypothetical protein HK096_001928 [Nowakowskiella sp. JEL0078]
MEEKGEKETRAASFEALPESYVFPSSPHNSLSRSLRSISRKLSKKSSLPPSKASSVANNVAGTNLLDFSSSTPDLANVLANANLLDSSSSFRSRALLAPTFDQRSIRSVSDTQPRNRIPSLRDASLVGTPQSSKSYMDAFPRSAETASLMSSLENDSDAPANRRLASTPYPDGTASDTSSQIEHPDDDAFSFASDHPSSKLPTTLNGYSKHDTSISEATNDRSVQQSATPSVTRRMSTTSIASSFYPQSDRTLKLLPLAPVGVLVLVLIVLMIMHSPATIFQWIFEELEEIPKPVAGLIVSASYSSFMILFMPKSVLGGISGFLFKVPFGFLVEFAGTFVGIFAVLMVGRNVIAPIVYSKDNFIFTRRSSRARRSASPMQMPTSLEVVVEEDEIEPLLDDPTSNTMDYGVIRSDPVLQDTLRNANGREVIVARRKPPIWVKELRKKLKLARRLYHRPEGWRLLLLMGLSPAIPASMTIYLVSLIGVPIHTALLILFACNLPYSIIYVAIGASAKNLADLIMGNGDDVYWKAPMMVVGIIVTAALGFAIVRYAGQMIAEMSKEEEQAMEADSRFQNDVNSEEEDGYDTDDDENLYYGVVETSDVVVDRDTVATLETYEIESVVVRQRLSAYFPDPEEAVVIITDYGDASEAQETYVVSQQ